MRHPDNMPAPSQTSATNRTRRRRNPLRNLAVAAAALLMAATSTSCAFANYDFDRLMGERGTARALKLSGAMAEAKGDDESLYDVTYIPLTHLDLHVYAESDDADHPDGYIEADVQSYLPLFGFVDADIDHYDEDHNLYESHEYDSWLWGLFQAHDEEITTAHGLRKESSYRLLWFISWGGGAEYVASGG